MMRAFVPAAMTVFLSAPAAAQDAPVFRIGDALGAPGWIKVGLEHRSRFESLDRDFRATSAGTPRAFSTRTRAVADVQLEHVLAQIEVLDARAYASDDTPLNTTIVNPLDVLQAYAGVRGAGWLRAGDETSIKAGRLTMNLGSRRLLSRSEFRNTISSFTGVDAQWSYAGHSLRLFGVVPVVRRPPDPADLADNRLELDRENTRAVLAGAFYASPALVADVGLEVYALGLHERDAGDAPSANRRIVTPGLRVLRAPAASRIDAQLEVMAQLGASRASTGASDTTDLDHRAVSVHASSGYRFGVPWKPRVVLQYDYASGDASPDDGVNGRFDPLYGSRRFELGPAGLYGPWARANLSSPGSRVEVAPHRTLDGVVAYRAVWLASPHDAWTAAGVRDPAGASGSFVGHQVEGRLRWQPLARTLSFEIGAAHLARGGFARRAPGGRGDAATYLYAQVTGTI